MASNKKKYSPDEDIAFLRARFEDLNQELVPSSRISSENLLKTFDSEGTLQTAAKRLIFTPRRLALALCAGFAGCMVLVYTGLRLGSTGDNLSATPQSPSVEMEEFAGAASSAAQSLAMDGLHGASQEDYTQVRKALGAVEYYGEPEAPSAPSAELGGAEGKGGGGSSAGDTGGGMNYTSQGADRQSVGEPGAQNADIMTTDGQYIYYTTGSAVMIASVEEDGDLSLISKINIASEDRYALDIYLEDNALTVLSNNYSFTISKPMDKTDQTVKVQSVGTTVEFYDISDRANPVKVREFTQEGEYKTSLVSGDTLYLVSERKTFAYYDILPVDTIVPRVFDSAKGEGGATLLLPGDIILPEQARDASYVTISALKLYDETAPITTRAVLGGAKSVICAPSAVYLFNSVSKDALLSTEIMSLRFGEDASVSIGRALTEGELPGQRFADVYDGKLRMVTVATDANGVSSAALTVFSRSLETVASLLDLEIIPSDVRFLKNQIYLIADNKSMITIDTADAASLVAKATSAAIPAGGIYLPLSDELVISLLPASQEKGLSLSLLRFNSSKAERLSGITLGASGSYSEAARLQNAFYYDPDKGLLGLPVTVTKKTASGKLEPQYGGYYVFALSETDFTLTLAGRVQNDSLSPEDELRRGVRVGNLLVTASANGAKSVRLSDFSVAGTLKWKA